MIARRRRQHRSEAEPPEEFVTEFGERLERLERAVRELTERVAVIAEAEGADRTSLATAGAESADAVDPGPLSRAEELRKNWSSRSEPAR